jgi:type IV pilus assembly protein PilA
MATVLRNERGFTLVELLVVVVILGALAVISLPMMVGQRKAAFDADAKSNARNAYTQVESCGVEAGGDYTDCHTAAQLGETGVPIGGGDGEVEITGASASGFTITARSRSGTDFVMTRSAAGRTMSVSGPGTGSW